MCVPAKDVVYLTNYYHLVTKVTLLAYTCSFNKYLDEECRDLARLPNQIWDFFSHFAWTLHVHKSAMTIPLKLDYNSVDKQYSRL